MSDRKSLLGASCCLRWVGIAPRCLCVILPIMPCPPSTLSASTVRSTCVVGICDIDVFSDKDDWATKIPGADTSLFLGEGAQGIVGPGANYGEDLVMADVYGDANPDEPRQRKSHAWDRETTI
jgi:hypothetical protein